MPPSMNAPKLWGYKATGKSLGSFTTNPRGTQAQDPTDSWQVPILCLRIGLHYNEIPQQNNRATGKPNTEY